MKQILCKIDNNPMVRELGSWSLEKIWICKASGSVSYNKHYKERWIYEKELDPKIIKQINNPDYHKTIKI